MPYVGSMPSDLKAKIPYKHLTWGNATADAASTRAAKYVVGTRGTELNI